MTDSQIPNGSQAPGAAPRAAPAWQPIDSRQRRILGVLVEKAKTTPDVYPMSLNALRTAANQKNNRYPVMELENEDIEQALERLRELGAVSEVQGDSRVLRYRHLLYDWLGVDKIELAVMAELLLRGAQSEGDLRARAARMGPIPDLGALRTIITGLKAKRLMVGLTPEGRGHIVTHGLYQPQEMEKLRVEFRSAGGEHAPSHAEPASQPPAPPAAIPRTGAPPVAAGPVASVAPANHGNDRALGAMTETVATLRSDVEQLRGELDQLRRDVDDLLAQLR